jgi:hypothetical protein
MKPVFELKDRRYARKNMINNKMPNVISRGDEERKMKKKGRIQKMTQAYKLSHGFLGNIWYQLCIISLLDSLLFIIISNNGKKKKPFSRMVFSLGD